jgi:hypothetical protein
MDYKRAPVHDINACRESVRYLSAVARSLFLAAHYKRKIIHSNVLRYL